MSDKIDTRPATKVSGENISATDASWILSNTFGILVMQTGFGMLEAGHVSPKSITSIIFKNIIDVTVGGLVYWMWGFGLSFSNQSNPFFGFGDFFFNADGLRNSGTMYASYFFHFWFATTATTIVSGAVAERMKLSAYVIFSLANTFIYCIPASWVWNENGFLRAMGFYDFAGAGVVHFVGGCSALVATVMLGPRLGRFPRDGNAQDHSVGEMSSPVTALAGMCMLWWAWLSFNCGSTFGVKGDLWKLATKVSVTTVNGSIGGSMAGLLISFAVNRSTLVFNISHQINGILGGLVGITAGCSVFSPAESLLIGFIGGAIAIASVSLLERLCIDDPAGATPVHMVAGAWGVLSVGLFRRNNHDLVSPGWTGVLFGGNFTHLGVQALGLMLLMMWTMVTSFLVVLLIKCTIGMRMEESDEILGADWVEHRVKSENLAFNLEKQVESLETDKILKHDVATKVLEELNIGRKASAFVDYGIINFGGAGDIHGSEGFPGQWEASVIAKVSRSSAKGPAVQVDGATDAIQTEAEDPKPN